MCTCGVPRLGGFKAFAVSARLWNQQLASVQRRSGVRLPPRAPFFLIEDERVVGPLLSVYLWCTPLCKRTRGSRLQALAKSASSCSCRARTHVMLLSDSHTHSTSRAT